MADEYAYISDFDDIVLFSIADLANPLLLDAHRMPDTIGQITASGRYAFVSNVRAGLQVVENLLYDVTAVEEVVPEWGLLAQNLPNPFNLRTEIAFGLASPTSVTLSIFDTRGRLVAQPLAAAPLPAGRHIATWDGSDASGRRTSSGVYYYRLEAGGFVQTRSMLLLD